MGRRSHSQTLMLWANGERVGRWTLTARGGMELQYDPAWMASPRGRPISLSLPFGFGNEALRSPAVAHYFEGLLPDSDAIRRRMATRFRTGSTDAFALLAAVGRDCVGALQLLPDGQAPEGIDQVDGLVVDEAAIERHLLEVVGPDRFIGTRSPDDDFRISLAGAQEKDAFLWWDGQWMKPRGATFGQQRVLVVSRFDRMRSADGRRLLRLVQEDFCQATGTSPLLRYESDGGPGLQPLFTLVQQSVDAEQDLRTLMASQILFWMLRAPDGHAKNFSIQLQAGAAGRFRLTPLYDVMSAYPVLGDGANQWSSHDLRLAMALLGKNRHYHVQQIQRRHFNSTARKVGFGADAETLIQDLVARTPAVVAQVGAELPRGFSQVVADTVLGGLLRAAQALGAMPAS